MAQTLKFSPDEQSNGYSSRWSDYVSLGLVSVTIIIAFAGLASWIYASTSSSFAFQFNVWGDRDLWRGLSLSEGLPPLGPEMIGGKRMPGAMFSYILSAIMSFGENAETVNSAIVILTVLTGLALSVFCWREFGMVAAAICLTIFSSSLFLSNNTWIWNPAFIVPFAAGILVCGYYFLKHKAPIYLCLALFFYAAGIQIHGQVTIIILVLLGFAIITPCRPIGLWIPAAILSFLMPFVPYLIWDGAQGFSYTLGFFGGYSDNYITGGFDSNNIFLRQFGVNGIIADFSSRMSDVKISTIINSIKLVANNYFSNTSSFLSYVVAFGIALIENFRFAYKPLAYIFDFAAAAGAFVGIVVAAICAFRAREIGLPVLFLAAVPTFNLIASFWTSVYDHHLMGTFVALTVMGSYGISQFIFWLQKHASKIAFVLLVAVFISAIFRNTYVLRYSVVMRPNTESVHDYHVNAELVAYLRQTLGFSLEDMNSRAAKFHKVNSMWTLGQTWTPATFSFLTSASKINPDKTSPYRCVAAGLKKSLGTASYDVLQRAIFKSTPFRSLKITGASFAETNNLFYILYNTHSENCAKNLSNPYIPTSFEGRHLSQAQPGQDFAIKAIQSNAAQILVVMHDDYQPFPTGFRFVREGASLRVNIHGRASRGYTGLKELIFKEIRLSLINLDNGEEIDAPLPQNFGSVAAYTPWITRFEDVPNGRYRVSFVGDLDQPKAFTPWLFRDREFGVWDLSLAEIEVKGSEITLRESRENSK